MGRGLRSRPKHQWDRYLFKTGGGGGSHTRTAPLCDIPSGCCFFTGPWTVTRSSLRVLRRVAAFCRPLRPVLLLGSFPRSQSPVVGVPGLCWMWQDVPFARQRRPVVGVLGVVLVVAGVVSLFLLSTHLLPPPPPPARELNATRFALRKPCPTTNNAMNKDPCHVMLICGRPQ